MASSQRRAPGHCARASALSWAIACATSSLKRPPPTSLHQFASRLELKSEAHACFTSKQPQCCGASTTAVRKSEFEERSSIFFRPLLCSAGFESSSTRLDNTAAIWQPADVKEETRTRPVVQRNEDPSRSMSGGSGIFCERTRSGKDKIAQITYEI